MPTVIAVNGSPRLGWNTHLLVREAMKGAESRGAETELFNLYEHDFKGCVSCFGCKRKGAGLGRCAVRDGLSPILDKIDRCDGLILGSPIYIAEVSAAMRGFLERLTFQYITYRNDGSSFFRGDLKSLFIYTMNVAESAAEKLGYGDKFRFYAERLTQLMGPSSYMIAAETLQVWDYDQYEMSMFNGEE
ncbi:MAG: flavodoxin family protein, partial [Treponema sp.]|nr:flavodoxin family protein [Treponema sp.]